MLEFHTQVTAHNRVHYCTFLIVSLLLISSMVWWLPKHDKNYWEKSKHIFSVVFDVFSLFVLSLTATTIEIVCRHTVKTLLCNLFPHIFFLSFFWHRISFHRWSIFLLVWYKTENLKLTQNILLQRVEEHRSRLSQVADER